MTAPMVHELDVVVGQMVGTALVALPAQAEPFKEEHSRFKLGVVLDLRLAVTGKSESFLDRGLGKTRYGGNDVESAVRARLAQASLVFETHAGDSFSTLVHLNVDAEPDRGGFRDRLDLVQAFARYRASFLSKGEIRLRGGLFFPPISQEHPGEAWTTLYTITPSTVNSWVGEEIRATGGEVRLARVGAQNEISAAVAGFGWNDPAGALLAYRGFAAHDRQTGLFDEVPLAPIPSLEPGGLFAQQAPFAEPLKKVSGRPGYYGALAWDNYAHLNLSGIFYNNRARPMDFDGEQYGWRTRFWNVGAHARLPAQVEILAQGLSGQSHMGALEPGVAQVDIGFWAAYVLASASRGPHRISARYDRFRVEDRDEFRAVDGSSEHGSAWTFAYSLATREKQRLALELLTVRSDRPARRGIGLPPDSRDVSFQASYRLQF